MPLDALPGSATFVLFWTAGVTIDPYEIDHIHTYEWVRVIQDV